MKKDHMTPFEIAHILINRKEQVIKTNRSNDIIYLYSNGYWEYRDSEAILKKKIQAILQENAYERFVSEILGHIRRETYIPATHLEKNRQYICFKNCISNLETGEKQGFTPRLFVTTKIPITYNPNQSTDEIHNYIKTLVDPNDIMKLQEHLGDILSPHTISKKLLYVYGNKNSGKSTLLNIIEQVIGRRNFCSLSLEQLGTRFSNFGIYERIANICSEMPIKITLKNLEHIKALTGGDYITIEKKYMQPFEYRPIIKHIFAANGIPRIDMDKADEAFYSRFDFIEFPFSFKPDSAIISKYTTEEMKSAWLNWMLEGYHRLKNNRWEFTNALDVDTVEQLFKDSQTNEHLMNTWLKQYYIYSPSSLIEKGQLHQDYLQYCQDNDFSSIHRYSYEIFCKKMLNNKSIPITSARRGSKHNQKAVFIGIKKRKQ